MTVFIGIDPGKNGGFASVHEDGQAVAYPWEDSSFISFVRQYTGIDTVCCVEKVGAMPGQGVTSMFHFGKSAGFIEGVLSALNIPYQLVPPQRWKKEFSLGHDKQQSIDACKALFPDVNLLPTPRCRKPSDGMAEAL